jgi:hypothetical protein
MWSLMYGGKFVAGGNGPCSLQVLWETNIMKQWIDSQRKAKYIESSDSEHKNLLQTFFSWGKWEKIYSARILSLRETQSDNLKLTLGNLLP